MIAFLITVLAILLLVGIIYLLLQEPELLAAGGAIALGVVFASLPLIISMAPFFGALVFGMGAVAITYGVMAINTHRRMLELRQLQREVERHRRGEAGDGAEARGSRSGADGLDADEFDADRGEAPAEAGRPDRSAEPGRRRGARADLDDLEAEDAAALSGGSRLARMSRRLESGRAGHAAATDPSALDPDSAGLFVDLSPRRTAGAGADPGARRDRVRDVLEALDREDGADGRPARGAGDRVGRREPEDRGRSLSRLARRSRP